MNQSRVCEWCGCPESVCPIHEHHLFRRGSHPDLIDDERNKKNLCADCHLKTEQDNEFYLRVQKTLWKK